MSLIAPFLVKFYLADHGWGDVKLLGKIFTRHASVKRGSNGNYSVIGYLGLEMIFSNDVLSSIKSVLCIFSFIAKAKVCRIYAEWGVA